MTTIDCPRCHGAGEIVSNDSLRGDPQLDVPHRCPECLGDGVASWAGVHTCHADCPCHVGGQPVPDFIDPKGAAMSDTSVTLTQCLSPGGSIHTCACTPRFTDVDAGSDYSCQRPVERVYVADSPDLVHLWRRCPDCGHPGAHHSYTDRAGESVGIRCG